MDIVEFIKSRLIDVNNSMMGAPSKPWGEVQKMCNAMESIIKWHENWPVMLQRQPTFEPSPGFAPDTMVYQMTQQLEWVTQQQYKERFGAEPPTAPLLRIIASCWSSHPDYQEEWRV